MHRILSAIATTITEIPIPRSGEIGGGIYKINSQRTDANIGCCKESRRRRSRWNHGDIVVLSYRARTVNITYNQSNRIRCSIRDKSIGMNRELSRGSSTITEIPIPSVGIIG